VDATDLKIKTGMVAIVASQWIFLAAIPMVVVGHLPPPDRSSLVFAAVITTYCFFTGYRAWRRQWKSRFILRAVVPIAIFILSCIGVGIASLIS
jgi:hypothetical protein